MCRAVNGERAAQFHRRPGTAARRTAAGGPPPGPPGPPRQDSRAAAAGRHVGRSTSVIGRRATDSTIGRWTGRRSAWTPAKSTWRAARTAKSPARTSEQHDDLLRRQVQFVRRCLELGECFRSRLGECQFRGGQFFSHRLNVRRIGFVGVDRCVQGVARFGDGLSQRRIGLVEGLDGCLLLLRKLWHVAHARNSTWTAAWRATRATTRRALGCLGLGPGRTLRLSPRRRPRREPTSPLPLRVHS